MRLQCLLLSYQEEGNQTHPSVTHWDLLFTLIRRYITWNLNNHRDELSRRGQLCRSIDEGADMTMTIKQMRSKSLDVGGGMENEQWSWMWPLHPRGCSQLHPENQARYRQAGVGLGPHGMGSEAGLGSWGSESNFSTFSVLTSICFRKNSNFRYTSHSRFFAVGSRLVVHCVYMGMPGVSRLGRPLWESRPHHCLSRLLK